MLVTKSLSSILFIISAVFASSTHGINSPHRHSKLFKFILRDPMDGGASSPIQIIKHRVICIDGGSLDQKNDSAVLNNTIGDVARSTDVNTANPSSFNNTEQSPVVWGSSNMENANLTGPSSLNNSKQRFVADASVGSDNKTEGSATDIYNANLNNIAFSAFEADKNTPTAKNIIPMEYKPSLSIDHNTDAPMAINSDARSDKFVAPIVSEFFKPKPPQNLNINDTISSCMGTNVNQSQHLPNKTPNTCNNTQIQAPRASQFIQNNRPKIKKNKTKTPNEKCYVVDATFIPESQMKTLTEDFQKNSVTVGLVYKKHMPGFTFCSEAKTAKKTLKAMLKKYSLINIEEDKVFKLAYSASQVAIDKDDNFHSEYLYSQYFYSHYLYAVDPEYQRPAYQLNNIPPPNPHHEPPYNTTNIDYIALSNCIRNERQHTGSNRCFGARNQLGNVKHSGNNVRNKKYRKNIANNKTEQALSNLPVHLFRMKNTGNLVFNNYALDNPVFRLIGISKLISYFYKYKYFYDGKGVNITIIDAPMCHPGRRVNELLLKGPKSSISKGATVKFINAFSCDGVAHLSKLISALDKVDSDGILLLPFYGPYSEALDVVVKKLSKMMTVVVAAGDDVDDACNFSPGGQLAIRVGSATKYGYVSTFSNRGGCVTLYSLGEDIFGRYGTGHSAAIVASAVAVYKEKNREAMRHEIVRFLQDNSVKNEYEENVMKIPTLSVQENRKKPEYYSWITVLIFYLIVISFIGFGCYFIWRWIREPPPRSLRPPASSRGL